jgi:signal peptidase I
MKGKKRHWVFGWIHAFLVSVVWVFFINQYALQAYVVPTGSMQPTVDLQDRIFFNKLSLGPELLPGIGKIPGLSDVKRDDIIIFENPLYFSKGPLFNISARLVYMLSFAQINLDKDETGAPRAQFLLKRSVGVGGDRVKIDLETGAILILPSGVVTWVPQEDFNVYGSDAYTIQRLVSRKEHEYLKARAQRDVLVKRKLPPDRIPAESAGEVSGLALLSDVYDYWVYRYTREIAPHDEKTRNFFQRIEQGIFVPPGRILPLGDNRDNSRDGRVFGTITERAVLGKPLFRYWPLSRGSNIH